MNLSILRSFVLSLLLAMLAGCNQADMMQKFASPADQALAKSYIDLLRQQRFEDIEKAADPSIAGPVLHDTLVQMAALIPTGEPSTITLVGAHRMKVDASSTVNLTFEYGFSGKWILTNVALKDQGGKITIVGFSVVPQPASLEEQNRFTLAGKTPFQYLVFALAILFPLITLWALVVCVKSKLKGRKWPWVLFVLLGFGKLAVNWTTGEWSFAPLSFQLFSAGVFAPLYGQWTIAIALPIGAVTFLVLRNKLSVDAIKS
jgi:hypothetical protein